MHHFVEVVSERGSQTEQAPLQVFSKAQLDDIAEHTLYRAQLMLQEMHVVEIDKLCKQVMMLCFGLPSHSLVWLQ